MRHFLEVSLRSIDFPGEYHDNVESRCPARDISQEEPNLTQDHVADVSLSQASQQFHHLFGLQGPMTAEGLSSRGSRHDKRYRAYAATYQRRSLLSFCRPSMHPNVALTLGCPVGVMVFVSCRRRWLVIPMKVLRG